ncbi:hypothetical protein [Pseudoalteromonas 'SMAR']|uniref:hypothetical protein n=1 Tax=Pseudoalteromonas 'SMAR' TaxID=3416908 RepID=UPI003AF2A661
MAQHAQSHSEQHDTERTPALGELKEAAALLLSSYQQLFASHAHLLAAKFRANFKGLLIAIALLTLTLFLTALVWASLHVLFAYALTFAGISWYFSAGIVLTLNIAIIYYLIMTGLKLFNNSIHGLTTGLSQSLQQPEVDDDQTG